MKHEYKIKKLHPNGYAVWWQAENRELLMTICKKHRQAEAWIEQELQQAAGAIKKQN